MATILAEAPTLGEGPSVLLESPGTHAYAEGAREGAPKLVQLLLIKAGYTKPLTWTLKIKQTKRGKPATPPLSVWGCDDKRWGIDIDVKPEPAESYYHRMVLHPPHGHGYKIAEIRNTLQNHVKSIKHNWRDEWKEEKMKYSPKPQAATQELANGDQVHFAKQSIPIPVVPVVIQPVVPVVQPVVPPTKPFTQIPERPEFKSLQGITKTEHKRHYFLLQCLTIERDNNFTRSTDEWRDRLMRMCNWSEDFGPRNMGKVIKVFLDEDYLIPVLDERNRRLGYALTDKAKKDLGDKMGSAKPQVVQVAVKPDYTPVLVSSLNRLDHLVTVAKKILANTQRLEELERDQAEIVKEMKALRDENEQIINQVLPNQDTAQALSRLIGLLSTK